MNICLLGNPNCGKTTLYNMLTGEYKKVGNWTGVTVEISSAKYLKDKSVNIVDLPGLYSLSALSEDEKVATNYLKNSSPKVIINIVDGTNLERNLFLTLQAISLNIPMIIAVNMVDQLEKNNFKIDYKTLSNELGVEIIPISALNGKNVDKLMQKAINLNNTPKEDLILTKHLTSPEKVYEYLNELVNKTINKTVTKAQIITNRIDDIITNKYLAFPIFICILALVYYLSSVVGKCLGGGIDQIFTGINSRLEEFLFSVSCPKWLVGLICSAIVKGVSSVVSFLPQIVILFALLGVLEQCGYMSRVCFLTDRLLKKLGVSGKSIIPLVLSCGCTVTGLMATRTIENVKERNLSIFISPFMPCGAKVVVFAWFSATFFNGNPLISLSLYVLSVTVAVVCSLVIKKISKDKESSTFILEMPILCLPKVKDIMLVMWQKVKEFLVKAGTIIFGVSVVVWLLMNFGFSGYVDGNVQKSFLFFIGDNVKYLFIPLGFGNWQASVSLISGLLAKEAVLESIKIVCSNPVSLFSSNYSVYAFMAFVLLSCPCMASLAQAKRELGSKKKVIIMAITQTLIAYLVGLIINIILPIVVSYLIIFFIFGIILIAIIYSIKRLIKPKCSKCKNNCKKKGVQY